MKLLRRNALVSCVMVSMAQGALARPDMPGGPADAPASPRASPPTTTELDRVTVTGSRIPRAGFDTLEPAQVIGREFIEQRNTTNIAEDLFDTPSFGASASYYGNQDTYGAGVSFASRFGLGSNRMLTLVNGRRFVTSNPPTNFGPASEGTQVDLNDIPTNMIERVENIGIGGAPSYGSDAISGVSNLILRDRFDGMESRFGYGQSERGDNLRYTLSNLLGSNFAGDRGHFVLSLGVDRTEGVPAIARRALRQDYALVPNPRADAIARHQPDRDPASDGRLDRRIGFDGGSGDGVPGNVHIRDHRLPYATVGGLALPATGRHLRDSSGQLRGFGARGDQLLQFDSAGRLVSYDPGTAFGGSDASGGQGSDPALRRQIVSDVDRASLYLTGRFDLNARLQAFWEGSWYDASVRELVDGSVSNTVNSGYGGIDGSGAQSGSLAFDGDHPLLTAQARETLDALGVRRFRLSRFWDDMFMRNAASRSQVWRAVGGLRGRFELAGRSYDWEASVNRGRGQFEYRTTGLVQQNFINALNVARDPQGRVACDGGAPGTVPDPACVPLDVFGAGRASQAAIDYVSTPVRTTAATQQTLVNANVTGGLFDLPGGEARFNVGYEYHREEAWFRPDAYQQLGQGRSIPLAPNAGRYHSNEYFGEVLLPLVDEAAGLPGLRRLDLTGKLRRVVSSVNGGFNAYTYGLQYEPVEGIQLRGNRTRSFRAPGIVELNVAQPAYYSIPEPCQASNIGAGPRPDRRRANCEAFFAAQPGVDPATFQRSGTSRLGYRSGNPDLRNEQARSWTAGLVFQPPWAGGLRVALDWYDIRISDVIDSLGAGDITSGCFDAAVFDAGDIANANRYCSLISRDPATGVADGIRTTFENGPYIQFRGWSADAGYRLDLERLGWGAGRVDLAFYGYFPRTLEKAAGPGIPARAEVVRRQYQWKAGYAVGPWAIGLTANYTAGGAAGALLTAESRDFLHIDSYTRWDASLGYQITPNFRANLAVTNLTDNMGRAPFLRDTLGRRYMLMLTSSF